MINRRMTEFKLFIHPVNLLAENRRKRIGRMERKKGKKVKKEINLVHTCTLHIKLHEVCTKLLVAFLVWFGFPFC